MPSERGSNKRRKHVSGIGFGVALGLPAGIIFGVVLKNPAVGLVFGLSIGLVFAVAFGANWSGESKVSSESLAEDEDVDPDSPRS